jgi:hypothetical protein
MRETAGRQTETESQSLSQEKESNLKSSENDRKRQFCPICNEKWSLGSDSDSDSENLSQRLNHKHDVIDCPERIVPCPFERYGCQWKGSFTLMNSAHLHDNCLYQVKRNHGKYG